MNKEDLKQLFQEKFDYEKYSRLIVHDLMGCSGVQRKPELISDPDDEDKVYYIGQREDEKGQIVGFFYTNVGKSDVTRKRVGLRKLIEPFVKYDVDAAIAVFDDGKHWRLSLVSDLKASAKRFSYVMGDPEGQYRTPIERLLTLQRVPLTIKDLQEIFSVEALSDDFFNEYKAQYTRFCNYLITHYPDIDQKRQRDYVKKMLGRLVFLHFLQKKGWLCDDQQFMLHIINNCTRQQDFLEDTLEPLFFGILNTPQDERKALFEREQWSLKLLQQWQNIPYLNGGLFERDSVDEEVLRFPYDYFQQLFYFFASYNFTVDENDPDDAEIGVDPEMLGKIFENLLEDNKDKGAFYTPKEIVRYMCKESLIAYLDSKVNGEAVNSELTNAIRSFVEQHELPAELESMRNAIDTALREVHICDPAIGSGAFPMGLLNELWRCREAIEDVPSRAELKKEIIQNNIYGVDIEQGAIDIARLRFWLSIVVDAEKAEPLPNFDYKFMQGNSLIESFEGTDLSRMLSDTQASRGKKVDVNQYGLDFSTKETKQNLQLLLKQYFSITDHVKKEQYRQDIDRTVKAYIRQQGISPAASAHLDTICTYANPDFFLWHTWFKDIFDKGGFDIVIGNPPYGAKMDDYTKKVCKNLYRSTKTIKDVQKGSMDSFSVFIEQGYNLLCRNGQLAYIVPLSFTASDSMMGIHRLIMNSCNSICVSSYAVRPKPVFKNAVVNTSVIMFRKTGHPCTSIQTTKLHRRGEGEFSLQKLLDNLSFVDARRFMLKGRIPKIGSIIECGILDKLNKQDKLNVFVRTNGYPIYYRFAGGRYFKVITNYSTGSSAERALYFSSQEIADAVGCILSSNLSFWFYQIYSDNLNWKSYEVENFPLPFLSSEDIIKLGALYQRYLNDIEAKANVRYSTGTSSYNVDSFKEYKIVRSKAIIDEIDDYIGPLYGLTPEEIDFIKNYELEFRMAGE